MTNVIQGPFNQPAQSGIVGADGVRYPSETELRTIARNAAVQEEMQMTVVMHMHALETLLVNLGLATKDQLNDELIKARALMLGDRIKQLEEEAKQVEASGYQYKAYEVKVRRYIIEELQNIIDGKIQTVETTSVETHENK